MYLEFILTDIHLNSLRTQEINLFRLTFSLEVGFCSTADRQSLLDKRKFSLQEVPESHRFNGSTHFCCTKEIYLITSVECPGSQLPYKYSKTLKQTFMGMI